MQSLYFLLWKAWKNNKKIVLKVKLKKLTLKLAKLISNKCVSSHISNFKRIHSLYFQSAPETHQEPTKACFEQFSGKKEQSNGFPGLTEKYEELEIPTNLISWLEICRNFQLIFLEKEKLLLIVFIKAPFLGTFILKIITYDFWYTLAPHLRAALGWEPHLAFRGFFIT